MKRSVIFCIALLFALCFPLNCLAATEFEPINQGETYLDGSWYLDEAGLQVGYNFFPNGGGFLFVGETVVPIRHGIWNGRLYVSDNGNVESFPFQLDGDGIRIDGLLYLPVEDDPDAAASMEAMLSEESKQSEPSETSPQLWEIAVQLITLAAAVGVVAILFRFLRKQRKQRP